MQTSIAILTARIAEISAAIESERRQAIPDLEALGTLYLQRIAKVIRRADMVISRSTQVRLARNAQTP